ncbi:MAG: hypothetical protein Pg6C_19490 [Treponemataceae bacterium]|nr:MAG: hypothetical protein Pg6C_19490 [Treponemataceae bacterium]
MKNPAASSGVSSFYKEIYFTAGFTTDISAMKQQFSRPKGLSACGTVLNPATNKNAKITEGFFFKNYSPGGSGRMYFTAENAGKIDYFRLKIEEWKNRELLTQNEYNYLLAPLIETVSDISNTAGVYGAFLKKWDPRAFFKACAVCNTASIFQTPLF